VPMVGGAEPRRVSRPSSRFILDGSEAMPGYATGMIPMLELLLEDLALKKGVPLEVLNSECFLRTPCLKSSQQHAHVCL
jgi:hypothetical protein